LLGWISVRGADPKGSSRSRFILTSYFYNLRGSIFADATHTCAALLSRYVSCYVSLYVYRYRLGAGFGPLEVAVVLLDG
jgi:hypothetical protein